MIRKWIVNNFFKDIVIGESHEFNRILMDSNTELKNKLNKIEYPTIEKCIDMLRGRIFNKEQSDDLKDIANVGLRIK